MELHGRTKKRRVIVIRSLLEGHTVGAETETNLRQEVLAGMLVLPKNRRLSEYVVLVKSLARGELLTIAQQYRDHCDAENILDE